MVEGNGAGGDDDLAEASVMGGSHVYLLDTLTATTTTEQSRLVTQEALKRALAAPVRFQKTVRQLVDLTRVLSFC